ncbi:MAG: hypothetical protein HYY64_10985 [Candidatus Rokubacteria bacterium]|nr:hypothetical protein [Candidatus Rokubacteria bacterium]
MRASVLAIAGLLASWLPAPEASAQQVDVQLRKIARRPAAVQPAPEEGPAVEEGREAARQIRVEGERAGLVEAARDIDARLDRESILRDVRQFQTIQRALRGFSR